MTPGLKTQGAAALFLAMLLPLLAAMAPWRGMPRAEMETALEDYYQGRFDRAEAEFQSLAKAWPEARPWLAAFYFERQDYVKAETAARALLENLPPEKRISSSAAALLARCQANQGMWPAAWETVQAYAGTSPSAGSRLLKAEALDALGLTSVAREAFRQALATTPEGPQAALLHFKAASFFERTGDTLTAEAEYKKTQKKDNSYTAVHKRLAGLYLDQDRVKDAKTRLERARRVDAQDEEALDALNDLMQEHPELALQDRRDAAKFEHARQASTNPEAAGPEGPVAGAVLRVGILKEAVSFRFKSGSCGLAVLESDGQGMAGSQKASLPADTSFEVGLHKNFWRLKGRSGKFKLDLKFDGPLILKPESSAATTRLFDVDFGKGYFWAGREDRIFRGTLEIVPDGTAGVTVVNLIGLEEYLLGVVASEMPAYWPREALRAQAIAARTDALRKRGRHRKDGFDLCDGVHCAMYRGYSGEVAATSEAVTSTAGEILQDASGRTAETLYMNSCGGHTQSSKEAWGAPDQMEPLKPRGVWDLEPQEPPAALPLRPDRLLESIDETEAAYCREARGEPASNFRWVMRFSRDELSAYVNRVKAVGELRSVEPLRRGGSGFVRTLRLAGLSATAEVGSDTIRAAVKGLKSNYFYVETRRDSQGRPKEFLFHGGGWGHGVGLCQAGAAGRAMAGEKGEEILKAYFPGTKIGKIR